MGKESLLKGAIILSIAGVVTKVISALYRVPYQNMAGDLGFYVYQQVYPFYGMAIIFATVGFPVVISKYVAEYLTTSREKVQEFIALSFICLQIAGIFLFIIFYIGAPFIASLMHDKALLLPIRAISFIFLFVPFVAVVRGFYQGQGNMTPTAITQIVEQIIRISVILTFTYIFVTNNYSEYVVGTGAAFGSITGVFITGILLLLMSRKEINYRLFLIQAKKIKEYWQSIKKLYMHGFAICLSSMALILFQAIDAFTVVPLLKAAGINFDDAKILKGIFDRGQPLIQLGTVIATSIALPLIPMLAAVTAKKKWNELRKKSELALRTSLLFGLAASVGLAIIIEKVNILLYTDGKGTDVLFILSFAILFSSLTTTTSAILQGAGYIGATARHVAYGLVVKVIMTLLLTPILLTKGAAIATVVSFLVIALMNIRTIKIKLGACTPSTKKLLYIINSAIMLVIFAGGLQLMFHEVLFLQTNGRIEALLFAILTVIIGIIVYIGSVFYFGVYSEKELSSLPILKKFSKFRWAREDR